MMPVNGRLLSSLPIVLFALLCASCGEQPTLGIENELGSLQEGYYSETLTQLDLEYVLPPRLVDHTDEDWDALVQAAPGPMH